METGFGSAGTSLFDLRKSMERHSPVQAPLLSPTRKGFHTTEWPFIRCNTINTCTMLTRHYAAILAIALFAACTPDPKETPQYQQLSEDSERAMALVAEKDSMINALFGTVNRISENLRTIRTKQGQLTTPGTDAEGLSMEQRIMGDIESIDGLLAENRALLERLRKQSKTSASTIAELERTVAELERNMMEKDEEIAIIKEQLSSTNSSLATLIEMYRDKSQLADMQRGELNTAFYAVGTAKELRDNGVLSKEGGVVGIGGVNKLNTSGLATKYFTKIDVSGTTTIPVVAKKAKLATSHPDGSYRFEGGAEKLVIVDAEAFWSISKYLVVVVE
jgi:hypothetical protein